MRYVSHTLADIMRPYLSPTELGVIIHANHNICWARNNNNPTMEDCLGAHDYELVRMHHYKVNNIKQIIFEDQIYEYMHRTYVIRLINHNVYRHYSNIEQANGSYYDDYANYELEGYYD